jgi:hypothetical protein
MARKGERKPTCYSGRPKCAKEGACFSRRAVEAETAHAYEMAAAAVLQLAAADEFYSHSVACGTTSPWPGKDQTV